MERFVWPIHGIGDDFGLFIWQDRYLVPTMFDGSARVWIVEVRVL